MVSEPVAELDIFRSRISLTVPDSWIENPDKGALFKAIVYEPKEPDPERISPAVVGLSAITYDSNDPAVMIQLILELAKQTYPSWKTAHENWGAQGDLAIGYLGGAFYVEKILIASQSLYLAYRNSKNSIATIELTGTWAFETPDSGKAQTDIREILNSAEFTWPQTETPKSSPTTQSKKTPFIDPQLLEKTIQNYPNPFAENQAADINHKGTGDYRSMLRAPTEQIAHCISLSAQYAQQLAAYEQSIQQPAVPPPPESINPPLKHPNSDGTIIYPRQKQLDLITPDVPLPGDDEKLPYIQPFTQWVEIEIEQ